MVWYETARAIFYIFKFKIKCWFAHSYVRMHNVNVTTCSRSTVFKGGKDRGRWSPVQIPSAIHVLCYIYAGLYLDHTMQFLPLLACAATLPLVSGHASLIMPVSRNAVDAELAAWSDGKHPNTGWIEPYNCRCQNGTDVCSNGQSCFWFSQGCGIGCKACDGNGARIPNFDHCPGDSIKPTVNDPRHRTVNQAAVAGSQADFTKFNPWRAPGMAPMYDPCGMAGGTPAESFNAAAYNTTKYAKQGDLGSKVLPSRPSGTVWHRGGVATTRWQNTALHGGGYQYRLCPASQDLTEACFQKTPLAFAPPLEHMIRFKNRTKDHAINMTVVPHAITGTGDWAIHPLPRCPNNEHNNPHPTHCASECDYVVPQGQHCTGACGKACGPPWYVADNACPTDCTRYPGLPHGGSDPAYFVNPLPQVDWHTFAVEDTVVVPTHIAPGPYVLGWRWDAESSSQIWASCADITIV